MLKKLLKRKIVAYDESATNLKRGADSQNEPVIIVEKVIEKSSLFNSEWYSEMYHINKEEAVNHYLNIGWKLGYDPSPFFSTEKYLENNPDIIDYNPLLHFELYGKKEGRLFGPPNNVNWFSDGMKYYSSVDNWNLQNDLIATIIIVITEYIDQLKENLDSILHNTDNRHKVMIINDSGLKTEIVDILNYYKGINNWKIINHSTPIGYGSSIDTIMSLIDTEIAVLLSPYTIVTQQWCEKLIIPYTRNDNIASTHPFTNYKSIFNFPGVYEREWKSNKCNHIINSFNKLIFSDLCESLYSIPVCMSINMKIWNKIGGFEEKNLENNISQAMDWCFRATNCGYSHKLIPNLYVPYIKSDLGKSLGQSEVYKKDEMKLQEKYPEIMNIQYPKFIRKDTWKNYRFLAGLALSAKKLLLMIDIALDKNEHSGALYYANKKIDEFEKDGFFVFTLKYKSRTDKWSICSNSIRTGVELQLRNLLDLNLLFNNVKVDTVFINNLAFNASPEEFVDNISVFKDLYHFKIIYVFHDHLSLCPSYFLLNADNKPCGLPDNIEICNECLARPNHNQPIRRTNLESWRNCFCDLFTRVDEFIFFSNYTKELVTKIYPITKNGKVIYHSSTLSKNATHYIAPENSDSINIGFVGRYDVPKGAKYFEELMDLLKKEYNVKPLIIGPSAKETEFEATGYYDKEELGKILTEKKINFVVFPSICNETFSYVVQELMLLNVPIVSFKCGGHAERVTKYSLGELADETSVDSLYSASLKMIEKLGLMNCRNKDI